MKGTSYSELQQLQGLFSRMPWLLRNGCVSASQGCCHLGNFLILLMLARNNETQR